MNLGASVDKACGNDGLSAEHLIHSDRRITILLSIFYNRVISHGYKSLDDFMKTIVIPLIKNKSGDTSNVNNYRPIALVTVASKIFEIILLGLLTPYLNTTDNQFGFKKGQSTGRFFENFLIEVCLLYLSVSCCTGTEPKHSVSNGVLQHQTFLMFRMVFDKVGFCPHIYLSYTLMN